MRRTVARVLFALTLAAAGAIAACGLSSGIETSVSSLVGGKGLFANLAEKTSGVVRVMCADAARAEACRAAFAFDPPLDPVAFLETVRTRGKGLLTAKSRGLLAEDELDRIRRSVRRRDYSGIALFPKADDPHYFLNDFVAALKSLRPEGVADGAEVLTGTASSGASDDGLKRLVALAEADDGIWLSGSPFHTLLATEKTKREINLLGTVSFVVVFLCGWLLFRSFRFVLPTACALAGGFVAGCAAVSLLPGRPHALTFLFGTTLIGLGVDYCYHALADGRDRAFAVKLTQALSTTCLAFSPLLLSGAEVLREMSVFTISGLVTIYLFALLFLRQPSGLKLRQRRNFSPACASTPTIRAKSAKIRVTNRLLVILLLSVAAFRGIHFDNSPAQFHAPEPVMARGEAKFAEVMGKATSELVLVPLDAWQRENAALKEKLGTVPGDFLRAADLPPWLTVNLEGTDYLMLPASVAGEGYPPVDPKGALTDLFAKLSRETYGLLALSFTVFLLATAIVFRRRFFRTVAPVAAAAACTVLALVALGEPINFFQALAFFILMGLGIDYSIFHGGETTPVRRRVVFFSFLTSFAGFGLLAFTSFPVTRSMGFTLGIGLFFAYVFSLPRGDSPLETKKGVPLVGRTIPGEPLLPAGPFGRACSSRRPHGDSPHWANQKEQSAGKIRILLMWWLYRLLGKNIAKILFLPAYLFIYPFCRPARDALKQYYAVVGVRPRPFRQILSFAWSMLDKTDACTLCKNPPTFTLAGDTDWTKGGCFLLSTHLGCIEVLPALRKAGGGGGPKVHAFQQMGHNAIFTALFAKQLNPQQLTLHAVEDIGVETAVEMKAAINRGEIVLMAGDRLSAATGTVSSRQLKQSFFGRDCVWPKGVFLFAKLMECPVYAIVCVKTGWNAYTVTAKRLGTVPSKRPGTVPLAEYVAFLEEEVKKHPYQWYQFYRFF